MWSVVVALPSVQADFNVSRAEVSLAYTLLMVGFAIGGVMMGRLADRFGVAVPVALGTVCLALGYFAAAWAPSLLWFALAQGVLIGFAGSSATFGPLLADTSHWFLRRRGLAVAIVASGNYLGGTLWPPILQHFIASVGWRQTHVGVGVFCLVTLLPLALTLRRRAPLHEPTAVQASAMPVSVAINTVPTRAPASLGAKYSRTMIA